MCSLYSLYTGASAVSAHARGANACFCALSGLAGRWFTVGVQQVVRVFLQRDSDYPAGVTAANFAAAIIKGGQVTLGGRGRSSRRLSNADMGAAKRRLSRLG